MPLKTRHRLVVELNDKAYLGDILEFIAKEFGIKFTRTRLGKETNGESCCRH